MFCNNNNQIKCNFLLILIFGFITFNSCENEESRNELLEKNKNDAFEESFEETAKIHNEAMEFIFYKLNTSKKDFSKSTGKKLTKEFIKKNEQLKGRMDSIADSIAMEEIERITEFRKSKKTSSNYLSHTITKYRKYLSEKQENLLYRVNKIVNSKNSVDTIIKKLEQIKNEECLKLPKKERKVIYAATCVGIKSIPYWKKHGNAWSNALNSNKSSLEAQFDWGSVGESDISGAVGGAIGGAISGSFAGGIGAGPGAIAGGIGGGIGTSATDAIKQLL